MMTGTSCAQAGAGTAISPKQSKGEKAADVQRPAVNADQPKAAEKAPNANGDLVYLKVENAQVSSFDDYPDWAPKPDAMAPVDRDMETRWASGYKDNQWIAFDFGRPKTISKIVINWEQAYPPTYEILTSDDGQSWKRLLLLEDQKGGRVESEFKPTATRYMKVVGITRVNEEWGISMWEFEPYGPKSMNPTEAAEGSAISGGREKTEADKKREEILAALAGKIAPSPGPITQDRFQKGVNYTSWDIDELSGELSDLSLIYLSNLGVKDIALMTVWYQKDISSKEISADAKKSVNDESLSHAINFIHALGMRVMLKPHVDLSDEDARSNIIPTDEWFASYKKFIVHYAEIASKNNVELFCIGTELAGTSIERWKDKWLDVIKAVKAVYKGPLVYAANWDEYEDVCFWQEMDYIGMDAYFPLTDKVDPTKEELVQAWEKRADMLETWLKSTGLNKPIIFTEIGYDTIEGSNKQPWRLLPTLAKYKESQDEQANCLEALLIVLSKRPWFKGFYWWNYFPRPDIGSLGYTLRGKKGEKILIDWFAKLK